MIWAVIKVQKEGYHYWKDAPEPVSFLRNKHRHIFHITVYIEQKHTERDVEYIMIKRWLTDNMPCIDGPESCEIIAFSLKCRLEQLFSEKRKIKVEVLEDAENGAFVE